MQQMRKIRVLVVDDSLVFREVLSRGLSGDPRIEVVAKASNAFEARDKILETSPDIITCDIQMPRMDGIEFIKRLLSQYPIPVIIVSSISDAVFDAMSAGAVEFVTKPDEKSTRGMETFVKDLIAKVHAQGKIIGIICHGGLLAISAKIITGGHATGSLGIKDDLENAGAIWLDTPAFREGNLVWGRVVADIPAFNKELVAALLEKA